MLPARVGGYTLGVLVQANFGGVLSLDGVPVGKELNRHAYAVLRADKRLEIVPGATHLFEEPGALDQVADRAGAWFEEKLAA